MTLPKHCLLGIVLLASCALNAHAGDPAIEAMWKDPTFKKQFVGSYGVNAEIEPRVTPEEVAILEKLSPLMGSDMPTAEETLQKAMKPGCSAVLDYTLGGLQAQQDKVDPALENYRRAVGKFPSFRRAWRNLGLLYVRNDNFDEAIKSFVKMIELGGGDAYSYGMLGHSYSAKQDFQPAEASYRNALLLQPDNTEWRLGLTRCALKQKKFDDCAALLDVLIARYPGNADFWMLQAHAFIGLKQPLKAAENFEAVDRLGKSTVDSLHTLGDIYASEKVMDLAASAYQRAIDLDPNQTIARPMRAAEILMTQGALRQAGKIVKHIQAVMGSRIADAERRKLLKFEARLSMAEGESSDQTAAVLEEVVRLDPLDGEALLLLGQHFTRREKPDQAIFYFERAESIEAYAVNARIRHAQVLVGLGRYADALPLLRRAQEARPREDVARYLEQIERLAKSRR